MQVLVLGGYGFIGAEISRALLARGHEVVGLGRDAGLGRRLLPAARWIGADLASLTEPEAWTAHLAGVEAIVNAAGALQDGGGDDLAAVHQRAVAALLAAAAGAGVGAFVQISAVGADAGAPTAFLRTKAAGDSAVRASALDWVVFRPGLVIGRNAYGGTALLRMLAATPFIEALALPDARVQTVASDDICAAVVRALEGGVPMRAEYDLVADAPRTLGEVVRAMRAWLGFAPARLRLRAPDGLAALAAWLADAAGALGWRAPLRTTALRVLKAGVVGDPAAWRAVSGRPLAALDATLLRLPATAQERVYARAMLAVPLIVIALSAFWIVSGLVGMLRLDAAAANFPGGGAIARGAVVAGALADLAIGGLIVVRRWTRAAALAGAGLAAIYLAAGSALAPDLWLDPLGAYVKVVPAIVLSLTLALVLEPR
jgi:uncharacterized protein YbjT (DUF2867 family)